MQARWILALVTAALGFGAGAFLVGGLSLGQNGGPAPAVMPREFTSYRDVVKRVLPAVVSIETRAKPAKAGGKRPGAWDDPALPEEQRRFFDEFRRLPVNPNESPRLGFGSGFLLDPSGVVVTNYHVVEGAEVAVVQLNDGRKFTSKNIRSDRRSDLAVILLDEKDQNFAHLEFGDSEAMEIGDRVLAVGAPFGLAGSVTHGIISAKGRNGLNMNMYEDFVQTDAAINPGNSGGPLVSLEGRVIGINAAIKSKSGGFQGVGLAITSGLAKNIVQSLRETGAVQRGYLGVQVRELTADVAARLGAPKDAGVVVADVYANTPASKAGLLSGDVILSIAGKAIKDSQVLQSTIAVLPINKGAEFALIRDGKATAVNVVIEEQPAEFGAPSVPAPRLPSRDVPTSPLEGLGVEVTDLTDDVADALGYRKGTPGAVVAKIDPDGISVNKLRPGMLIQKIDDTRVSNTAAAQKAIQAASLQRGVLLQIATPQGGANFLVLRSAAK